VANSFAPLVYEYEFRIPVDFAYIVRAIMILEGVSRQLDPDFDIFAVSAPYAVRMMLTFPSPGLRQRLMGELLTADGRLDWQRLRQLAGLASRDAGFRLEADGLLGPVLDLLLSPEGAALRRALVLEILSSTADSGKRLEEIGVLLAADRTLSGRAILDRLVVFLLSPEGAETRAQLSTGLRSGASGRLNLARATGVLAVARKLHPDFRLSTLLSALGGYLTSEEGKPVRAQLLRAGTHRMLGGVLRRFGRTEPAPAAAAAVPMPLPDQAGR